MVFFEEPTFQKRPYLSNNCFYNFSKKFIRGILLEASNKYQHAVSNKNWKNYTYVEDLAIVFVHNSVKSSPWNL